MAAVCSSPPSHFTVCDLKTGNDNKKQHTSNRRAKHTRDFVQSMPSPPPPPPPPPAPHPSPCFNVCVGALLSEHDVLSSHSCSHLPRHTHTQNTHTRNTLTQTLSLRLFHLNSSERRSPSGSPPAPPSVTAGQHLSVLLLIQCYGRSPETAAPPLVAFMLTLTQPISRHCTVKPQRVCGASRPSSAATPSYEYQLLNSI